LRELPLNIVLYCPLNDPDDGGTSGDRRMARQLRAVLASLGHVVQTVASPRTHVPEPDGDALDGFRAAAVATLEQLRQGWTLTGTAPDLWLTYHNYHKAPDLLGPRAAAALAIPYVIAEASHTASKSQGPWALRTGAARVATMAADLHFCFTAQDRQGLLEVVDDAERLVDLPPFIDTAPFSGLVPALPPAPGAPVRLISVAMMRKGGKTDSHAALAQALRLMPAFAWSLTLAGDGPARPAIEAMFQGLGAERVNFAGLVPYGDLPQLMAAHDLFVWPGLNEPFGLVFLEAQAAGLAVVAFRSGGVPDTVRDGETAILVPEGDVQALATAIAGLATDPGRRVGMAAAACRFALDGRGLADAAKVFARGLDKAVRLRAMRETAGKG
jgi:glycosyltransferase involved in cell wall biosynthesis